MVIDTNGLTALADGERSIEPVLRSASRLAVPVVVLGEYRYGIRQSHNRAEYEQWLAQSTPVWRVLGVNAATAEHYAAIRHELKIAGTPIPSNDLWIAALVRQHAMPLLSRDRHFDLVAGLTRIGW
jgi:predicted nucleic acid-binding protein